MKISDFKYPPTDYLTNEEINKQKTQHLLRALGINRNGDGTVPSWENYKTAFLAQTHFVLPGKSPFIELFASGYKQVDFRRLLRHEFWERKVQMLKKIRDLLFISKQKEVLLLLMCNGSVDKETWIYIYIYISDFNLSEGCFPICLIIFYNVIQILHDC